MSRVPRFCPFCRECFEDVDHCPAHELELVSFERLPPERQRGPDDDEPLGLHDLRFGRGWLLLSAVLLLVGMAPPLVSTAEVTASAYELAADRALNLWMVLAVGGALLSVWMRRRTLARLRGSRIAVAVLAGIAAASVIYTLVRIHQTAARLGVVPRIEWGVYVLAVGVAVALVAALRLGGPARP